MDLGGGELILLSHRPSAHATSGIESINTQDYTGSTATFAKLEIPLHTIPVQVSTGRSCLLTDLVPGPT
jgi:hypothetical protein